MQKPHINPVKIKPEAAGAEEAIVQKIYGSRNGRTADANQADGAGTRIPEEMAANAARQRYAETIVSRRVYHVENQ
jgi:hypothetical protein